MLPVVYLDVRNPIINDQGYELFNKTMSNVCMNQWNIKLVQIKQGYHSDCQYTHGIVKTSLSIVVEKFAEISCISVF